MKQAITFNFTPDK